MQYTDEQKRMLQFYNNIVDVQTVPAVNVDYQMYTVINPFIANLMQYIIKPCFEKDKVPMFVFNDMFNKVGISSGKKHSKQIMEFNIDAKEVYCGNKDSAVVNLLQYNGWFNANKTLMQEIAEAQWLKYGFTTEYKSTASTDKLLFTSYLLENSICYIEILRSDGVLDKFFTTRNVNLLMQLSTNYRDKDKKEPFLRINKDLGTKQARETYTNYLMFTQANIATKKLTYLKLAPPTKRLQVHNIVIPRGITAQIDINSQYRIVPMFLLQQQFSWLQSVLTQKVATITYVKDNLQLRNITTTLNTKFLTDISNTVVADSCKNVFKNDNMVGYIKVPDLDLLKSDSYLRVLNTRICKIFFEDFNTYINKCNNVVLQQVPDICRRYIKANMDNVVVLQQYYIFIEMLTRKSWFDAEILELQHYTKMCSVSQNVIGHKRMVDTLQKEIADMEKSIKQATYNNIIGKQASELYIGLISFIENEVQQRSTEFCKQLHLGMLQHTELFPQYLQMIQQMKI